MKYKFSFGKKKPNKKTLIIVGIILSTIVSAISNFFRVSEEKIWDLVDEVQRRLPSTIIRDIILLDPTKVERRVNRDVDKAIKDYERLTPDVGDAIISSPTYSETPVDDAVCSTEECKSLGGAMELTQ